VTRHDFRREQLWRWPRGRRGAELRTDEFLAVLQLGLHVVEEDRDLLFCHRGRRNACDQGELLLNLAHRLGSQRYDWEGFRRQRGVRVHCEKPLGQTILQAFATREYLMDPQTDSIQISQQVRVHVKCEASLTTGSVSEGMKT
jgi:hypothetical protein